MCYLKNLEAQRKVDFDQLFSKDEQPSAEGEEQEEANVLIPCAEKQMNAEWSAEQQMLVNLFDLIEKNNNMISALGKALSENSEQLEKSSIQTESTQQIISSEQQLPISLNDFSNQPSSFDPSLRSRLFGNRKYKYSMRLASQFSPTLYKERNFNISLELIDQEGKLVRNCNMINLCFAVATNGGQWIHQNRIGDPFMKGKTEVELYNGQASFAKIYARDVSRSYQDGKVNLVVYPKPSTLVYSNVGSFETSVDSNEIEPLILEDISIKAKKKD